MILSIHLQTSMSSCGAVEMSKNASCPKVVEHLVHPISKRMVNNSISTVKNLHKYFGHPNPRAFENKTTRAKNIYIMGVRHKNMIFCVVFLGWYKSYYYQYMMTEYFYQIQF